MAHLVRAYSARQATPDGRQAHALNLDAAPSHCHTVAEMRRGIFALACACACGPVARPDSNGTTSDDPTTTSPTTQSSATLDPTSEHTTDSGSTTVASSPNPTTDPTTLDTSDTTTEPCDETTGCDDTGVVDELCDPWLNDCPVDHECTPWANDGSLYWNAFRCSPIADNPDAIGDPCTVEGSAISGIESCESGGFCFFVDPETNTGTCAAMCTGSPDDPMCDDPSTTCAIEFDGYITLCLEACDPLLDDCDVGVCAPSDDDFVCAMPLEPDTAIGEACYHHWGCASGGICTAAERLSACDGDRCCAAICDITLPEPCEDGLFCDPWYRQGQGPGADPPIGVCVAG